MSPSQRFEPSGNRSGSSLVLRGLKSNLSYCGKVDGARAIIDAFALPENAGKGVIQLNGKMVELLHADMARRTLAIADAIAALHKAAA